MIDELPDFSMGPVRDAVAEEQPRAKAGEGAESAIADSGCEFVIESAHVMGDALLLCGLRALTAGWVGPRKRVPISVHSKKTS